MFRNYGAGFRGKLSREKRLFGSCGRGRSFRQGSRGFCVWNGREINKSVEDNFFESNLNKDEQLKLLKIELEEIEVEKQNITKKIEILKKGENVTT